MLKKYFESRRIRHRLERLDDWLLRDMGIDRSEIREIARGRIPASLAYRSRDGMGL